MNGLRLNLGCGKRHLPGFIHVDEADFPHIDQQHSVRSLPFFENECAELIYASHVIEYFDRHEVIHVLREWHRVLIINGLLRIAVPDFKGLVQVYHQYEDLNLILGPLYGRMVIACDSGEKTIYHKTVYDFDSLSAVLEESGFSDVQRYDWRQTLHKEHDDHSQAYVPHMDKAHGTLISLNVEARKTGKN